MLHFETVCRLKGIHLEDGSMIYRYFSMALFLIFILNAVISHSQTLSPEQIWKIENSKNTEPTFYVLYADDNKYKVDKLVVPKDQLQQVLEKHIFSNKRSALNFIKIQKNISLYSKESLSFSKLQTEDPSQVIWAAQNQWSWEWEVKYSDWIKENFNKDFFVKYNIATDCADVAVSLRWIFSRINSLPAAQTFILSGRVFSNESMKTEWETLPTNEEWDKDERFLTALRYVLENTFTHSLYADSYPIQINASTLLLGTHFLILRGESGHTLLVSEIVKDQKIYTLCSTTPALVRRLARSGFSERQPQYYETAQKGGGGFLKIRWPRKTGEGFELVPREEMPFYSLEQYTDDFIKNDEGSFSKEVHTRLGLNLTPEDRYHDYITSLLASLEQRISIVNDGFAFCSKNDCSVGSTNYENYSTPSRDARILDTINEIQDIIRRYDWIHPNLSNDWKAQQSTEILTLGNTTLNLGQIIKIWSDEIYSSNPNDPVAIRWGINAEMF